MKGSLYTGKIAGIKIYIHWTFLILLAWITYSNYQAGKGMVDTLYALLFTIVLFACITLHELGHALTARRFKIRTRDITLLPIGGIASLETLPKKPLDELLVAIAGPLVNIGIALALLPITGLEAFQQTATLTTVGYGNFLPMLVVVNGGLALFNLIPAFPLDGGRVFRALLSLFMDRNLATRIAATTGQLLAIAFIFLGFAGNPFLVIIGLFIFMGAQSEAQYTQAQTALSGYTIKDILIPSFPVLDPLSTVREAAQQMLHTQNRNFIVLQQGNPVGTLSREDIIKALNGKGEGMLVVEAMDRDLVMFEPGTTLPEALEKMQRKGKSIGLVKENDEVIGAVDMENFIEFMMVREAKPQKG